MPKSTPREVEQLDPASMAFIARHALLRLTMQGSRSSVQRALSTDALEKLAVDLLQGEQASDAQVRREHGLPSDIGKSAFYRWTHALREAALEVHRDMLADRTLPQLARVNEVATALRLPVAKVQGLIDAGELPTVEITPGEHRIPKADVADLIAARARKRDTKGRFKAPD